MRKSTVWYVAFVFILALAISACAAPAAPEGGEEAATGGETVTEGDPLTYWVGLTFSDEGNQMVVDRIKQFGEEKGIPVEAVVINQNEMVQKLSAAIEAGNLPDGVDIGQDFALLMSQRELLVPLDDLYAKIGEAQGGWLNAPETIATMPDFGGTIYGIPYGTSGNVLYRRTDVLEAGGYTEAPATWMEMSEMAAASQTPPENYGLGFALSNVGDANMTTTMMQSFGGRVADDAGENCTLDSQGTRDFLEWITTAFEDGLFPPGVATWDGAGDNTCYQSAACVFIGNPGSVYVYMRDSDPELLEATKFSAFPAGSVMQVSPANTNFRVIPATSDKQELAKELVEYLLDPEFLKEYYAYSIYGAVLEDQLGFEVFQDSPVHAGLTDLAISGTPGAYPDVNNAAYAEYQTNYLTPKMVLKVVIDGKSIDDAIAETQTACQEIYDKYKE